MLAMTDFGQNGRLGNQLFQYAFMRSQAERLGTNMYLPSWIGDQAFDLQDAHIRCDSPEERLGCYREPADSCGYNPIRLQDNVDVSGYFQSEHMFDAALMRRVYSFHRSIVSEAIALLGSDFDQACDVSVGMRLTDFDVLLTHYVPQGSYYKTAIKLLMPRTIFLFSDDSKRAEMILRRTGFNGKIIAVEASPINTLAAMSRFSRFIIGPSTFHWWGAWLSAAPGKIVVAPREGATRPGGPVRAVHFWPAEWKTVRAMTWIDGYKIRILKERLLRGFRKLRS